MTPSHYWTLLKLTNDGRTQAIVNPAAQTFYQNNPEPDRLFHDPDPIAKFCLRCFISHQITFAVRSIVQRFSNHRFDDCDLLPLVLDDDGTPNPNPYIPLSLKILNSYNPESSSLTNWTIRKVRQHPEIKQFLLEQGIYLRTSWGILNAIQPNNLRRLLTETNRTPLEISQSCELLIAYRTVYLPDRLRERTRKPCLPPTSEQLTRIADRLPNPISLDLLLKQLLALSQQIREDDISRKASLQTQKSIDEPNYQLPPESEIISEPEEENHNRNTFLHQYRSSFTLALKSSIIKVIHDRTTATPKKAPQFLTALQSYYCKQIAMGEIAELIGVRGQDVVSRLMRLKDLRSDIRCHMLSQLKTTVLAQAEQWLTPQALQKADRALDSALDEQLETLMQEESQRDKTTKDLKKETRLSTALCEHLDSLLTANSS